MSEKTKDAVEILHKRYITDDARKQSVEHEREIASQGAEIARLEAENERLEKRLAAAGNELDTLRKAVWFLEPYEIPLNRKGWFLDAGYADIEKLQKEMGK